jgi:hypothetical protein
MEKDVGALVKEEAIRRGVTDTVIILEILARHYKPDQS